MKLYVSGPITNVENHIELFRFSCEKLQQYGFQTLDPHDIQKPCQEKCGGFMQDFRYRHTWECNLKYDIIKMLECDGVALMPGYEFSNGANLESYIARKLYMPTKTVNEWCFTDGS